MSDGPIVIDTAEISKKDHPKAEPAWVRIGGTEYEAKFPGLAAFARYTEESEELPLGAIERLFSAIFGEGPGEEISGMLHDQEHEDVTLESLISVINALLTLEGGPRWTEAIEKYQKSLGSGEPPRTIAMNRAPKPRRR